jgi:hypothetical protein
MVQKSSGKNKMRLLKVAGWCMLVAAAVFILAFAYNVNSSRTQSYKNHEKYIDRIVASSLRIKDPNNLTSEDLEKVKDIDIWCNVERNLNPLARLKNLNSIRLEIAPNRNIDLRPLVKLKHLNRVELNIMPKQRIDLKPLARLKSLKALQVEFPGTYSKKADGMKNFLLY